MSDTRDVQTVSFLEALLWLREGPETRSICRLEGGAEYQLVDDGETLWCASVGYPDCPPVADMVADDWICEDQAHGEETGL